MRNVAARRQYDARRSPMQGQAEIQFDAIKKEMLICGDSFPSMGSPKTVTVKLPCSLSKRQCYC